MGTQLKGSLEQNLLTVLTFSDEHASTLTYQLNPQLFSTRPYRKIATRAFEYIQQFGKPPKSHIADLLEADLNRGEEGTFIGATIRQMEELQSDIQIDYVLSELHKFIRLAKINRAIEEAADAAANGDIEAAENALYKQDLGGRDTPGIYLHDAKSMLSFLDQTEVDFFSSGVEELDKRGIHPQRGTMFILMAPPKRGKSWSAIQMGKSALLHRKSVLHITLEMSEQQVAKRYIQALYSMASRDVATVRIPTFTRDDLGRCTSIDFHNFTPDVINDATRAKIAERLTALKRRRPVLIKSFPSGSLTVAKLQSFLDMLERKDGFVPDLVIVDYPDLMAISGENRRTETGGVFVHLRGLAQARNFALVCPTQGNRQSSTARLVRQDHVSEDWSKVMTTDFLVTYNQTQRERSVNLARLFVAAGRSDEDMFTVLISQSYATGQFCLESTYMSKDVSDRVDVMTGEPVIPPEDQED